MLPTKEQLIQHLSDKNTNQDVAKIYGTSFQKIIQLIKKYELNPNELRKVDKLIVYEHLLNEKVVYVGSGLWYRMRRSSTRRNLKHKQLMEQGKIDYRVVAEYDDVECARKHEERLIERYKNLGQCRLNLKYDGIREEITNRSYTSSRPRRNKNQPIDVWKDGEFFGEFNYRIDFAREISNEPEKLLNGISLMLNKGWEPKKGPLGGFKIKSKNIDEKLG